MHACAWSLAVVICVADPLVVADEVPPDERLYTFDSADVTYAELIDEFAHQAGLDVVGDVPNGHIRFPDCGEPIPFQLAISRINTLLFLESHHYLCWDSDFGDLEIRSLGTQHFPLGNIYPTVDEFLAAERQSHELVAVLLTPRHAINDWPGVACLFPPFLRSGEYAESKDIVFFGAVSDVKRYISLAQMMGAVPDDRYRRKKFRVIPEIAPGVAQDLESKLASVDVYREIRPVSGEGLSEEVVDEHENGTPEVLVWYDDLFGSVVVRYTPALENTVIRTILELSHTDDRACPPVPIP